MANKKASKVKAEFRLRRGVSVAGVKPDTIGNELKQLYARDGALTPPAVVAIAEPEEAPLHPVFEWDDEKCGKEYRLFQARALIKNVEIVKPETQADSKYVEAVRAYEYVPDGNAGAYHPVEVIVQRPDMYAAALRELSARVRSAEEAMQALERAAKSADEIDADRLTRITIAVQAMQTASAAVQALH